MHEYGRVHTSLKETWTYSMQHLLNTALYKMICNVQQQLNNTFTYHMARICSHYVRTYIRMYVYEHTYIRCV